MANGKVSTVFSVAAPSSFAVGDRPTCLSVIASLDPGLMSREFASWEDRVVLRAIGALSPSDLRDILSSLILSPTGSSTSRRRRSLDVVSANTVTERESHKGKTGTLMRKRSERILRQMIRDNISQVITLHRFEVGCGMFREQSNVRYCPTLTATVVSEIGCWCLP